LCFGCQGIARFEFIRENETVNERIHVTVPRHIRHAVRRKRPEKWRTNSCFPLHNNAPAHRTVFVKDFLAKINITTLEHPTFSPDLDPADFHPFPRLKSALKGRCFYDGADIIKNETEELKRFPQNGSQEYFQHVHIRWQKYTIAQGDSFKGIVV